MEDEIKCDVCGATLDPGDEYHIFRTWICCSETCLKDKMYELFDDEITTEYIKTEQDLREEAEDDKYHAEIEERGYY